MMFKVYISGFLYSCACYQYLNDRYNVLSAKFNSESDLWEIKVII